MTQPKTDAQRNAAHVWFREVAKVLNEAALDKKVVIERLQTRGIDMPWTEEAFKEDIYKPIFEKVTKAKSTEDANRTDHNICYEGLVRWFGQEFGLTLPPWPTRHGE